MNLIVQQQFSGYMPGDRITDAAEVSRILACEQAAYVLQVADQPATTVQVPASTRK